MSVSSLGSRVEVIVPFHNQGLWLAQACRSLQAQSEPRWRALLINDNSDAEALAIAKGICLLDRRFQLLHLNCAKLAPGPWMARNLGIKQAKAPLVAFLDADDLWHPQKLERQLALHASPCDPAATPVLSVCSYHRFQVHTLIVVETRQPPDQISFEQILHTNVIPLSTVIIDRSVLLQHGGFRGEHHEDYGLWLRLFAGPTPPQYRCLPEPLMAYRLHGQSLSSARRHSALAVNRLFRQHLHRRRQRWPALLRWGVMHARQKLLVSLGPWLGTTQTYRSKPLPEPFYSLIVPPEAILRPATAGGAQTPIPTQEPDSGRASRFSSTQ